MNRSIVACCFCVIIATVAIDANPIKNQTINFAAEVRRIVQQSGYAAVGPNSTINAKEWTTKLIKTVGIEATGEIFFHLSLSKVPQQDTKGETQNDEKIFLIFNDKPPGLGVMMSGIMKKVDEKSKDYSRNMEAYRSHEPIEETIPEGNFYKLDILDIHLLRVGEDAKFVSTKEYYAGTDSDSV